MKCWEINNKTITSISCDINSFLKCFFFKNNCDSLVLFKKHNINLPTDIDNISLININYKSFAFLIGYLIKEKNRDKIDLIKKDIKTIALSEYFNNHDAVDSIIYLLNKIIIDDCLFIICPSFEDDINYSRIANILSKKTSVIMINGAIESSLFKDYLLKQKNYYCITV